MTTESKSTAAGQMWLNALMRSRQGSLVLLIAVLTVLTTALNPRFISPQSLKDLMLNVSIIALLVLGRRLSS
jgi:rhamnose transport system permease protein